MTGKTFYGPGSRAGVMPATFARTRSDAAWVHLEQTNPARPLWHDLAAAGLLILFSIAAFVTAEIISII